MYERYESEGRRRGVKWDWLSVAFLFLFCFFFLRVYVTMLYILDSIVVSCLVGERFLLWPFVRGVL